MTDPLSCISSLYCYETVIVSNYYKYHRQGPYFATVSSLPTCPALFTSEPCRGRAEAPPRLEMSCKVFHNTEAGHERGSSLYQDRSGEKLKRVLKDHCFTRNKEPSTTARTRKTRGTTRQLDSISCSTTFASYGVTGL